MAIAFTESQEKVIRLHNRNILVSAAAGSGKTAVLVERIIQMVCNEEHPVDIDRLLVVTFTNAAAAEMRERISSAVSARLEEHPESVHLQRQAALVHNAQITTIDSFCLFLIRNNFNEIDLDPSFRVADEGEGKLLQQEVLAELLEEAFSENNPDREDFLHCVECYAAGGREKRLEELILQIYQFAMSYPWPEEWLRERQKDYDGATLESWEQQEWFQFMLQSFRYQLEDILEQYDAAIALTLEPDGPHMYGELLEQEREQVEGILAAKDFTDMGSRLGALTFARLSSKKDETVAPHKREAAKDIRTKNKDRLNALAKKYFKTPIELMLSQSAYSARAVHALLELCLTFKEKLDAKKREKNLLDFHDMEHFALDILLRKTPEGMEPTGTAREYRSHFEEVLIDEYQDSNLVQEYLLKAVSGEEDGNFNRFMVGDVKQSIYKFRLARPELFLEKYHTYTTQESSRQRIELQQNFRSRKEVLQSVNYVFSQIMGEKLGGIRYDSRAALYPGADFPENPGTRTEIWMIPKPEQEDEEQTDREREAYGIARGIHRLREQFRVTDKQTGELRPCRFGDIVVLLRTNSGWDEVFKEVFARQGIPAHVATRTGYFSTTEIQNVMQLLRVLDNPRQDIPLFGTLRSCFGGFSDEELVKLRLCRRGKPLYEAVCAYVEEGEEEDLRKKTTDFLQRINRYRDRSVFLTVRKLLQEIFEESGYLQYVAALPAGEQRLANVEMLLSKAAAYEQNSYYGLFHFIRYMEQLEKYDVDCGEANLLDESADVVRIMSIHKSKGLEFPVTIVAGMAKRFNMQDTTGSLIMDMELGLGTDYVDPIRRLTNTTFRKNVIAEKMKQDNLAEEMRVLYVAMTRAREKLILSGIVADPVKTVHSLLPIRNRREWMLDYGRLQSASSYWDYVLPALARHPAFARLAEKLEPGQGMAGEVRSSSPFEIPELSIEVWEDEVLQAEELTGLMGQAGREEQLAAVEAGADPVLQQKILERFSYRYPHENLQKLYTKTTVSELKLAALEEKEEPGQHLFEEEIPRPYLPAFARQKEGILATTRGSAFHKVMELLDLSEILKGWKNMDEAQKWTRVCEALERMHAQEKLSDEYYEAVAVKRVMGFLDSGLAERMKLAGERGQLYREQPFVYAIDARKLNPQFPEEEKVLIQGIVDVFFIEEGELVLADYKTDVVQSEEQLMERYQVQLDYYAQALEKMWHMPVREQILYSTCLGCEIRRKN